MENNSQSDQTLRNRLSSLGEEGVYAYAHLLRTHPRSLAGGMADNIHDLMSLPRARLLQALRSRYSHYVDPSGREMPYTTHHAQSVGEPNEVITEDGGLPFHKAYALGQRWASAANVEPALSDYVYTPVRNDRVGANDIDNSASNTYPSAPEKGVFTVGGVSFVPERKTGHVGPACWGVRVLGSGMEIHPAHGAGTIFKSSTKAQMIEDVARSYEAVMKYGQEDDNENRWRTGFGLPAIKSASHEEALPPHVARERG
jgi:hypothetical protein